MLHIEIRLYSSDGVGGKYNTALCSIDDDGVEIALEIFKAENFKALVPFLEFYQEIIGRRERGYNGKDYMGELFGRIFKMIREDTERYERFLDYLLADAEENEIFFAKHAAEIGRYYTPKTHSKIKLELEMLNKYYIRYILESSFTAK